MPGVEVEHWRTSRACLSRESSDLSFQVLYSPPCAIICLRVDAETNWSGCGPASRAAAMGASMLRVLGLGLRKD